MHFRKRNDYIVIMCPVKQALSLLSPFLSLCSPHIINYYFSNVYVSLSQTSQPFRCRRRWQGSACGRYSHSLPTFCAWFNDCVLLWLSCCPAHNISSCCRLEAAIAQHACCDAESSRFAACVAYSLAGRQSYYTLIGLGSGVVAANQARLVSMTRW